MSFVHITITKNSIKQTTINPMPSSQGMRRSFLPVTAFTLLW